MSAGGAGVLFVPEYVNVYVYVMGRLKMTLWLGLQRMSVKARMSRSFVLLLTWDWLRGMAAWRASTAMGASTDQYQHVLARKHLSAPSWCNGSQLTACSKW